MSSGNKQSNGSVPNGSVPNGTKKKNKKKSSAISTSQTESRGTKSSEPDIIAPPKGFLPFNHSEITPKFEQYARDHLNETPETRERCLKEMRELLTADTDLKLMDRDDMLLVFLRSKKMDVKRAVEFLKTGLLYIEKYRYILERKEPEMVRKVISKNMIGFLPYRDPDGRAIIYSRADAWDPAEIPAADTIFAGVMAVQSAGLNPVNQIIGFIVILDLKDLKFQQLLAMSRWMIFGTITLQRACPCFLKAFHVINVPSFYKLGWKLVKPLLSEKIRKRFIFHKSSDLSSLYSYVPREILPPELDGPIPFSNEHWAKDIDTIEKDYYFNLNNNYYISRRKTTEASQS